MKHTFNISIVLDPFQKLGTVQLGKLEPSNISELSLCYRADEGVSFVFFSESSEVRIVPIAKTAEPDIILDSLTKPELTSLLDEIVKRGFLANI